MADSASTPDGDSATSSLCGTEVQVKQSRFLRDAVCPICGCKLWVNDVGTGIKRAELLQMKWTLQKALEFSPQDTLFRQTLAGVEKRLRDFPQEDESQN